MGTDALLLGASNTVEHDQGFNGEDAPGPSDPQLDSTAQPRGLCPLGTSGRWLCGGQYCGRFKWDTEQVSPGCNRAKG